MGGWLEVDARASVRSGSPILLESFRSLSNKQLTTLLQALLLQQLWPASLVKLAV